MGVILMLVKVGCCGFPVSRRKYYAEFKVVEIQQTFYKPPSIDTMRKWREEAPEDFEFTFKAWQVITHSPKSPTWRKAKIDIPKEDIEKYGLLKPTKENIETWRKMLDIAKVLRAKIIVLQTPPSLRYDNGNIDRIREFFDKIMSINNNVYVAWEPRGQWHMYINKLSEIFKKYKIIHVVDPFKYDPIPSSEVCYLRLHGRGKREVNYRYKYTQDDYNELLIKLKDYSKYFSECYVMFNNVYMFGDAREFKEYVRNKASNIFDIK